MNLRRCLIGCVLFLAIAFLWLGVAGGIPVETTETGSELTQNSQLGEPPTGLAQEDIDADSVLLRADIRETGDATWSLQYRLRLDDDETKQAFEELEAELDEDPSTYLDSFEERLTETVRTAEAATDREMSADGFAVSTRTESQPQAEYGIVTFEFEWSGFAAVNDEEIRAGDAIDQLFLEEDQRLQMSWPDSYGLDSTTPEPAVRDQQRVVWRGPIDFDAGQPRIVLSPVDERSSLWIAAGLGLAVVGLGAVAYWWHRREKQPEESSPPVGAGQEGGGGPDEPTASGTTDSTEPAETSSDTPPELLSNEERILQLLQENGGRMKQKAVAEELDWSAAKTSQVVSDLRDAEEVESFRLGRENILTLPDVDLVEREEE